MTPSWCPKTPKRYGCAPGPHGILFYEYSFDGERFTEIPVKLDAKILSDDYVNQRYGGFFTGARGSRLC